MEKCIKCQITFGSKQVKGYFDGVLFDEDMTSMDMDMGGEWHGSPTRPSRVFKSRRRPEVDSVRISKVEAQRNSSSSPSRSPGAVHTKIDAQAAYGVRFGFSLY